MRVSGPGGARPKLMLQNCDVDFALGGALNSPQHREIQRGSVVQLYRLQYRQPDIQSDA